MNTIPLWVDRSEYPFEPKRFSVPAGVMSYVDEGSGSPVVMVHGNPAWSFLYRTVIKALRSDHRCIAPDHIGFGLSDKPRDWSYLPEEHAKNFEALMEFLDLRDITLIVGDWGGPIGLSYAIAHPDRIKNIIITNTWCWPVNRDWYYIGFSSFVGGPIGRWLIRKYNFFAKTIVWMAFGNKRILTPAIHRHYLEPLKNPQDRKGCWIFPKRIIGSTPWLRELHQKLPVLAQKNIALFWGLKDIGFRLKELRRWRSIFPAAHVREYADAGHYLSEEKPQEMAAEVRRMTGQRGN